MTYKMMFKNVYKYNIFATTYKNKWIKIFGLILKLQKRKLETQKGWTRNGGMIWEGCVEFSAKDLCCV